MLFSLASSLARLTAASCRRQTGFRTLRWSENAFRIEISTIELPPRAKITQFNSAQ